MSALRRAGVAPAPVSPDCRTRVNTARGHAASIVTHAPRTLTLVARVNDHSRPAQVRRDPREALSEAMQKLPESTAEDAPGDRNGSHAWRGPAHELATEVTEHHRNGSKDLDKGALLLLAAASRADPRAREALAVAGVALDADATAVKRRTASGKAVRKPQYLASLLAGYARLEKELRRAQRSVEKYKARAREATLAAADTQERLLARLEQQNAQLADMQTRWRASRSMISTAVGEVVSNAERSTQETRQLLAAALLRADKAEEELARSTLSLARSYDERRVEEVEAVEARRRRLAAAVSGAVGRLNDALGHGDDDLEASEPSEQDRLISWLNGAVDAAVYQIRAGAAARAAVAAAATPTASRVESGSTKQAGSA